jgi:hypothetical protein
VVLARREQEAAALLAEIQQEWERVRAEAAADTLRARLEGQLQVRAEWLLLLVEPVHGRLLHC